MDTTLIIMAAGIGSRYGAGIKQLAKMGPNGEIIMDFSIHDAIEAGFNRIIFIIRKDIEDAFKEVFLSPKNRRYLGISWTESKCINQYRK